MGARATLGRDGSRRGGASGVRSPNRKQPPPVDPKIEKELKKAVQKTAATFAPRVSTKPKNPAVPGTALYSVFEVQGYASMLLGEALSFNLIFPSNEPDIWRLMGMWLDVQTRIKSALPWQGKGAPAAGKGAPAAALAGRFGAVASAAAAPTVDRSSQAAAASLTLPSFEASCLPAWWTSSSPMGSSEGYGYY